MEVVEVKNTHTTKVRVALERNRAAVDAGIPPTVCLKANWAEASTGDICEREARFYDLITHDPSAWVPTSFYADWDPGTGRGVVVMEDLVVAPGEFGASSDDIGIDGVAAGLESLAAVHAALWGDPRLDAPWMAASMGHGVDTEQVIQLWNYIEFNLTDPAYEAVLPGWVYERPELLNHVLDELTAFELSQGGPQCLVHGDAHQGNSFFRADGTRIWLDWQLVRRGQPWRDVSYFMVGALDVEDRRDNDRALFRHYHECLTARVGDGVASIDEAWDQFVRWPGYGMQAWLGNINIWGQDSGVEMVRRFFAAAEDYDTVALLTEGRRPRRSIAVGEGAWPLTPTLRSAIEARTSHAGNRVAMAATVPGARMSTTEGEELPADHGVGAFTERAPWVVAPETMSWRAGIAELRRDAAARVPGLVERRRIPPARGATVSWRLARTGIVW